MTISYMTQRRHQRVAEHGIPELIQALRDGKISPYAASEVAYKLSPAKQLAQLNEHLANGGGVKRWRGSFQVGAVRVNRLPKRGLPPTAGRITPRELKSDEGLVEQTLALLHRLREVAGKIVARDLYDRIPEWLRHNLDLSIEPATELLVELRNAHRYRDNVQRYRDEIKKTAGEPAAQITDQPKERNIPWQKQK